MTDKIQIGICGMCDITEILKRDEVTKQLIPTENYAEFSFVLSDEVVYRHSICKQCIVGITDQKVNALIERIKANWMDEMVGWATDKQFVNVRNLTLVSYDQDEKQAVVKAKKDREEKHREKAKQAKKEK